MRRKRNPCESDELRQGGWEASNISDIRPYGMPMSKHEETVPKDRNYFANARKKYILPMRLFGHAPQEYSWVVDDATSKIVAGKSQNAWRE